MSDKSQRTDRFARFVPLSRSERIVVNVASLRTAQRNPCPLARAKNAASIDRHRHEHPPVRGNRLKPTLSMFARRPHPERRRRTYVPHVTALTSATRAVTREIALVPGATPIIFSGRTKPRLIKPREKTVTCVRTARCLRALTWEILLRANTTVRCNIRTSSANDYRAPASNPAKSHRSDLAATQLPISFVTVISQRRRQKRTGGFDRHGGPFRRAVRKWTGRGANGSGTQ